MSRADGRLAAGARSGSPVALVTGATGFIGSHLVASLVAGGWTVRVASRRGASPHPSAPCVGSPTDAAAMARAMAGASAVVHLAGLVHARADAGTGAPEAAAYEAANVAVTRQLAEAAAAAGVSRFVLMSSVAALCTAAATTVDARTEPRPTTAYGRSKLAAERAAADVAAASALHVTALRPPMVYGPGMPGNPLRLFRLVERGIPLPLGAVRNRRSLLYVGNLVAAIRALVERPTPLDGVYLVSDPRALSSAELVRLIAGALGRSPRLVPVPMGALRAAGRVGDVLARIGPWPLTSDAVDRLTSSLVVDGSPLARACGTVGWVDVEEAIGLTARWYLASEGGTRAMPAATDARAA